MDTKETQGKILYEDADHKFIWLGCETKYRKGAVQTMQYLIICLIQAGCTSFRRW